MASAQTYVPIATQTLASSAAAISFTSIPNTYTDLVLKANLNTVASGGLLTFTFNNDSSSGLYSYTLLGNNSTTPYTAAVNNQNNVEPLNYVNYDGVSNKYNPFTMDIQNYANTSVYKSVIGYYSSDYPSNFRFSEIALSASLWRNTSAISTITLNATGSNFATGCTATLYGILAA